MTIMLAVDDGRIKSDSGNNMRGLPEKIVEAFVEKNLSKL